MKFRKHQKMFCQNQKTDVQFLTGDPTLLEGQTPGIIRPSKGKVL